MTKRNFIWISIYVPKAKQKYKPLARLAALGRARDRSLIYLIVEAVLDFAKR